MTQVVHFDTETFLIQDTLLAPPLVCITYDFGAQPRIVLWNDKSAHGLVEEWLTNATVCGHNVAYDLAVLGAHWPDLVPLIFQAYDEERILDTGIRQKLLDIADGCFRGAHRPDGTWEKITYHLADLARRHLNMSMSKGEDTWRLRYGELRDVPLRDWPHEAKHYALLDAETTRRVYESQETLLRDYTVDVLADQHRQFRAAWWLHLTGCWGMRIDPAKMHELEAEATAAFEECQARLVEEGLVRIEKYKIGARKGRVSKISRDTKAAAARMLEVCEENVLEVKRTPGGGVCLNEEACEDSGDPILQSYAEYTALGNVLGKDVKAMSQNYEIHGRFDSLVASGRSSCRGFNLQNLRRKGKTRECFAPRPGFVFCLIDLDTAELRAVAQVCLNLFGHSRLAEVINSGKDAHCLLTADALGIPYDEVKRLVDADDETMSGERQLHKHGNFALWGGMREKRFRALIKHMTGRLVTEEKVRAVREAWLDTWPEAGEYLDLHERLCAHRPATIEQLYSGRWRGGLRYSEACNTRFQGLIADAAKAAGYAVCREMYIGKGVLRGSRILNFPHDELICEVPEDVGHECAVEIQRIVLEEVGKWLPDVPPKAAPYLARFWSKKGFQLKNDKGLIIPWNGEKKAA